MSTCSICKEKDGEIIQCDSCQILQCQKCTNLTTSEVRAVAIKKRQIIYFCDCCRLTLDSNIGKDNKTEKLLSEIIKKLNELQNEFNGQKNEISKQKALIEKQSNMIEMLTLVTNSKDNDLRSDLSKVIKTQEDIVEKYSEKTKKRNVEPVVVIKPKDPSQKHDDTRKIVKNYIDPTKIAVSSMKNVRDGGVIIGCKNKSAAETLKAEAHDKLGEHYNIIEPKKQLPKVKIVGITETNIPEEIEELLYLQNENILTRGMSEVKVVHVAQSKRNKRSYIAYVQVDGESYNKILKVEKINIGWDRCTVYDSVDITMCYNCCGFNHIAKNCNKNVVCAKCGSGHSTRECEVTETDAVCVNCKYAVDKLKMKNINYYHNTWSKECPAYRRNLEIKKSKTNFL